MKHKKFFIAFIMSSFLAVGSLFAVESANGKKARGANAVTDIGTVTIDEVRNAISDASKIYLLPTQNYELPDSWDYGYTGVGINDGVFINGVKQTGASLKYAGTGSAYITFYYGLPKAAEEGDIIEFKGTFACNDAGYSFTINYATSRFAETWVHALEKYDTVSLVDANMPNFSKTAIQTVGEDYAPTTDKAGLPSRKGYFGLTNNTGSYAFQFNYKKTAVDTGWFNVLIGGSGTLYSQGHFLNFGFLDSWAATGHAQIKEQKGTGNNWSCETIRETGAIALDWTVGGTNLLEMGAIKLKGSTKRFVFFKVNDALKFGEYWELAEGAMTTKVCMIYNGTDADVTNSIEPVAYKLHMSNGSLGSLYTDTDICPAVHNWDDYFKSVSGNGLQINGNSFGNSNWNYFKKTGATGFYFDFAGAGAGTPSKGDILYIGGMFKAARAIEGSLLTLFKVNFADSYFEYNGSAWVEIEDICVTLYDRIASHCELDYYDEDKVFEINSIIDEAEFNLPKAETTAELWSMYNSYIAQLDNIPINEEKAREILNNAKAEAKAQLNALVDETVYDETNLAIVRGYVNAAIALIDSEDTDKVSKVDEIIAETLTEVAAVETKLQKAEKAIMASDTLLPEYLEAYDVVSTTDLCAVGDLMFRDKTTNSYSNGGLDDITARMATKSGNKDGNMIFQFVYESDKPNARIGENYAAQIFIRMRGASDSLAYRFEIANNISSEHAGVGIARLVDDVAVDRVTYDADLKADTQYKIECGAIDLAGFDRTMLFIKVNDVMVLKTIVDSIKDAQPVIRIMDSFVEAPHYAKMSAIEEGTTKGDNATLIGRLILDPSSDKDSLIVTLRSNNIEEGKDLYPLMSDVFKLNGEELTNKRARTRIHKISDVKYIISIDKANPNDPEEEDFEFKDGDVLSIGGLFAAMSTDLTKSAYKLFGTVLTFDADTNSWSQETPTDPEVIRYEAEQTIRNYVDLSNYSETGAEEVEALMDRYVELVYQAEVNEIPSVIDSALQAIDTVPTILDEYKAAAKEDLEHYRSPSDYRAEEQAELNSVLEAAYAAIDKCEDKDSVDLVVLEAKASIDDIKTAEERDAEDLAEAKKAAKLDVDSFISRVEPKRYTEENVTMITNLYYAALDDIDAATSIDEVNSIVSTFKEAVKGVKTKDGSTFDGEKYISKKKSGCGGSIETVSMLSFVALFGAAALLIVKKLKEN